MIDSEGAVDGLMDVLEWLLEGTFEEACRHVLEGLVGVGEAADGVAEEDLESSGEGQTRATA